VRTEDLAIRAVLAPAPRHHGVLTVRHSLGLTQQDRVAHQIHAQLADLRQRYVRVAAAAEQAGVVAWAARYQPVVVRTVLLSAGTLAALRLANWWPVPWIWVLAPLWGLIPLGFAVGLLAVVVCRPRPATP
jgi:hypothetical protein